MAKKDWQYTNVASARYGSMVCIACSKQIEEGQYRWRETAAAYLSQHRKCCADDPVWAKLDRELEQRVARVRSDLAEYTAFRAKHGNADIDEEIASMHEQLRRHDRGE